MAADGPMGSTQDSDPMALVGLAESSDPPGG